MLLLSNFVIKNRLCLQIYSNITFKYLSLVFSDYLYKSQICLNSGIYIPEKKKKHAPSCLLSFEFRNGS